MTNVKVVNKHTGETVVLASVEVVDRGDYVVVIPVGAELDRRVLHRNTFEVVEGV